MKLRRMNTATASFTRKRIVSLVSERGCTGLGVAGAGVSAIGAEL